MTITVEAASQKLHDLAVGLADRSLVNRQIGVQLEGWVLRNFQQQGGLVGGWLPLAPSTILARLRKSTGTAAQHSKARGLARAGADSKAIRAASGIGLFMILQDSGALRQSFAAFSDNDEAGVGAQSNAAHADLAKVHQFGDPSRNIPARPMLPPVDVALNIAVNLYQSRIADLRANVGL